LPSIVTSTARRPVSFFKWNGVAVSLGWTVPGRASVNVRFA